MQSISVYETDNNVTEESFTNIHKQWKETINNNEEELEFKLFVNETVDEFKRCHIIYDEIKPLKARVFQTDIDELIVTNTYEAFINISTGLLIVFANKKSADGIYNLIADSYKISYNKKLFDLKEIINQATDVTRAQFRKLNIETINGSSLSGNQVTSTNVYQIMDGSGELSTVAVTYPYNNGEIKFSVSDVGSIVIFSTVEGLGVLDLIELLLQL